MSYLPKTESSSLTSRLPARSSPPYVLMVNKSMSPLLLGMPSRMPSSNGFKTNSAKDNEVRSLQQELEQIQAGVSTMATQPPYLRKRDPKKRTKLSQRIRELRVALKAASALCRKKDVFSSVAAMKPTVKQPRVYSRFKTHSKRMAGWTPSPA